MWSFFQYLNGSLKKTIQLDKVDGNLEGFVKDTGIFAKAPNFLYKTKEVLDKSSSYKLLITEADNGKEISSSTEIIDDFQVLRPAAGQKVNFFPGAFYNTQWYSAKDGKIYALTVRFYYKELNAADTTIQEEKYLDWPIVTSERSNSTAGFQPMDVNISGDAFIAISIHISSTIHQFSEFLSILILCFQLAVKTWILTIR